MLSISSREFSTRFALRPQQFAWLVGAGGSAFAGIPTGYQMILDFKAQLFTQLSGVPRRHIDCSDPIWQERIDEFFRKRSELPPSGDPTEYSAAFEALHPTEAARRQYIENAVRQGTPTIGHRVLGVLIASKLTPCVFTTNFDQLIESAATIADDLLPGPARAHPTVAALDSADRAERSLRESAWPLIAKLHGDYQSVWLKNTSSELEEQDGRMRRVLTGACTRFGLIVVGYSGRDSSVMDALTKTLREEGAFPSGIYWVTNSPASLLPSVTTLIEAADSAGVDVTVVECPNFDEFATDLADAVRLPHPLDRHVFSDRPPTSLVSVPLPTIQALKFPVLRCSALPVRQMPTFARRIALSESSTTVQVRELLRDAKAWAVASCNGREVAAFGGDEGLLRALAPLGAKLAGTVELDPIADSWALGLLYDALTRALCRGRPLFAKMRRSGHFVLAAQGRPDEDEHGALRRHKQLAALSKAYNGSLFGKMPQFEGTFNEGIQVRLEQAADRWWCVFDLTTYVERPLLIVDEPAEYSDRPDVLSTVRRVDPAADWRRERWAQRYNPFWSNAIAAWADILACPEGAELLAYGLKEMDDGIDACFRIEPVTAWSRPAHAHAYFDRGRQ